MLCVGHRTLAEKKLNKQDELEVEKNEHFFFCYIRLQFILNRTLQI